MKNLRKRDHITEQNIAKYLDSYFYPMIREINPNIEEIIRVTSREEQLQGKDIIISHYSGREFVIDEKVATNYNTKLTKFAFELDSYQSDKLVPGWLVTDNETDFYLLGWIDVVQDLIERGAKINSNKIINEEDINYLELVLISKAIVKDFLSECGFDLDSLMEIANDIRNGVVDLENQMYLYKNDYDKGIKDFHFTLSGAKVENPLMVNIRKEKLIELGQNRLFIVDENNVKVIDIKNRE